MLLAVPPNRVAAGGTGSLRRRSLSRPSSARTERLLRARCHRADRGAQPAEVVVGLQSAEDEYSRSRVVFGEADGRQLGVGGGRRVDDAAVLRAPVVPESVAAEAETVAEYE